jgi:hypothetical protein
VPQIPPITPLWALTLCAACWRGDAPVAPPPAALVDPCPQPQGIPLRALTEAEVVIAWRRDRAALVTCGDRHGALAGWALGVSGAR